MLDKMLAGFSPRLGLQTLCKLMPDRVGHPVERFEMRFFADEKRIDFLVYMPESHFQKLLNGNTRNMSNDDNAKLLYKYNNEKRTHLYKFEQGEKICTIALKLIAPKLPADYTLQYAIINYDENNKDVICEAYGVKNDVKEKQTIVL